MNTQECLKLLNLSSDATGQDVKLAYRKAVKQWHPDRHQQASALVKEKAEKQMQALNTAYTILSDYYDKHGYLPGYIRPESTRDTFSKANTANASTNPADTNTHRRPFQQTEAGNKETQYQQPISKKKSSGLIWFAAVIVVVIIYSSFDSFFPDNNEETMALTKQSNQENKISNSKNSANTNATSVTNEDKAYEETEKIKSPFSVKERTSAFAPSSTLGIYEEPEDSKYFTYGDTGGRVFEIQGVPTKTIGDIWYYGQSEVHFQNGRVKSWVISDTNLKAKK